MPSEHETTERTDATERPRPARVSGLTTQVAVRIDSATRERLDAHLEALRAERPHATVTLADAARDAIERGLKGAGR